VAGIEIITELDKLIADLDNPRYRFDPTHSYKRFDFQEHCCLQSKKPFNMKPLELMLWQKAWWEAVYSFQMADTGFRRFTEGLLLVGRKNGKTVMMAADGNTDLFIGDGGTDICCMSNDDSQSKLIWREIAKMKAKLDPKDELTHSNLVEITNTKKDITVFRLSAKTQNKDGRNIDKAYYDEAHDSRTDEIYAAGYESMSTKDEPFLFITTTEGFLNGMFLDEKLQYARQVLNDEVEDEHFLPWLYTQDSEQEVFQDRRSWEKSNPSLNYGVKKWSFLDRNVNRARVSKSVRMHMLCKDFNIKQNNAQAWLDEADFIYPATFNPEDFRDSIAVGAVDLSETTDLTSAKVLMLRPDDRTKYVQSMYWIPESKLEAADDRAAGAQYAEWAKAGLLRVCEGNENDLAQVADWYLSLYKDYGIRTMVVGYDQRFAKDFLNRMDEYGLDCELVVQNKVTLSNPMKLVEADLKSRLINYNENPIDRWCLRNASMEMDNLGRVMAVKINNQRERRIDGAVTMIILYEMYRRHKTILTRSAR